MNEKKIYIARLKHTNVCLIYRVQPRIKTKTKPMSKRKTVRPGVHEISPASICGEIYGGKDLRRGVL